MLLSDKTNRDQKLQWLNIYDIPISKKWIRELYLRLILVKLTVCKHQAESLEYSKIVHKLIVDTIN